MMNQTQAALVLMNQDASNQEPPTPHLDLAHLHEISDHSSEFEQELLQLFVNDSILHLEKLKTAIFRQDFYQAEQSAHYLKGASASLGAKVMERAAEQLEYAAHQRKLEKVELFLSRLSHSLLKIQELIYDLH